MCTGEVLPSQDASLPQIESTKPLAFVNQQLQVVIRDEALIKKLLAPVAFFFWLQKAAGPNQGARLPTFLFKLVPNCLLFVFK